MRLINDAITTVILLAALSGSVCGTAAGSPDDDRSATDLVQVRAEADVQRIVPGRPFMLAVDFRIEPLWHIYWDNPGESGMPTEITVDAPPGFTVGTPIFTRPRRFVEVTDVTYGYAGRAMIFVPVTPPSLLEPGSESFTIRTSFLVCKGKCLMGTTETTLVVPTEFDRQASPGDPSPLVTQHRKRVPQLPSKANAVTATLDGDVLEIIGSTAFAEVDFYPIPRPGVSLDAAEIHVADGRFRVRVPIDVRPHNARGRPMTVEGLVVLGRRDDDPCYSIRIPIELPDTTASGRSGTSEAP